MRISIWHQFSSNHSARFTVVGVFESDAKAREATEKLTRVLKTIGAWYHLPENSEALNNWLNDGNLPPSPVENQLAEYYGIEWSELSLDWIWFDEEGNGPIRTFDHLVFIDGTESWLGSKPADALVEKIGGKVLVDGSIIVRGETTELWGTVHVTLTCNAPDEAMAQSIQVEVLQYLASVKQDFNNIFGTPWRGYGQTSSFEGIVACDGRKLTFDRASFFHIAEGFPAMLAYLRDKGCADIQYEFTEKRELG